MHFSVWPVAPQPWADTLALGRPGERVDRFAEARSISFAGAVLAAFRG
jgi:hypothetical protein